MAKTKILFVDDEPKVLQGIVRMLRSMREEWEVDTAESGEEALHKLEQSPADVLVSDMRMPGMDGAQLLTEVMKRHPQIIRIVLSGQSDQDTVMRSIGPTHQYLSKPCDTDTLKRTIQRAYQLRGLLADPGLRQLVSQMQSIPSMPALYTEVLHELQSPDPDLDKVGWIISRDMGMTGKILHLVNSAFFGFYSSVSNPTRAITILGLDKVRSLVLSIHIFSQFDQTRLSNFQVDALWRHSLRVGQTAKEIAFKFSPDKVLSEEAFMAGLLHDAGILVLMANRPDDYARVLSLQQQGDDSLEAIEHSIFGASHAEIGAYLFGLWGLADPILEAVAYHHHPEACLNSNFSALSAVHIADQLDATNVRETDPQPPPATRDYLTALGLDPEAEWIAWRQLNTEIGSREQNA